MLVNQLLLERSSDPMIDVSDCLPVGVRRLDWGFNFDGI